MENKNLYKYRILKLTNGLGEVGYRPQCKKELSFIQLILFIKYKWEIIDLLIFKECRVLSEKERLDEAKENVERHKGQNIWTEEIIKV